ncbi:MAG: carbamoyltransferase HypF, partial [Kiritimatiellia bacterium]
MRKRLRITISGRVQGVGFRPAVYRHARRAAVAGFVKNTAAGVMAEAEGEERNVTDFLEAVRSDPPPHSVIESVRVEDAEPAGVSGFEIAPSAGSGDLEVGMPPDLAICEDCRRELFEPENRRYKYPFINCTNCGPRFTIIRFLPYDRAGTSMSEFAMCGQCGREYRDLHDRRFDAQPNACFDCGPRVELVSPGGEACGGAEGDDILETAVRRVKEGEILAVKGLGGYHLACDALSDSAVSELRKRKHRPDKPLAVMFRSAEELDRYCVATKRQMAELETSAAPVVVVGRRENSPLSQRISPDTGDVGAFLPYTPLHCLLLAGISPLVMTSGNRTDEPIAADETDLGRILGPVADRALVHDRRIVRRCDDSVVKFQGNKRIFVRRSRGFVPDGLDLPFDGPEILACGSDMKNTFCLTRGRRAFPSQHIGDLGDNRNYMFYTEAIRDLSALLGVHPDIAACDPHPDYFSSRYGREQCAVCEPIQHHYAHSAACMAENGLTGPCLGVILDGAGLGGDGTVWGGEFIKVTLDGGAGTGMERVGRFKQYPMPGGDAATLHPARMAFACLYTEFEGDAERALKLLPGIAPGGASSLQSMIEQKVNTPLTSSAGRLFDAVSAMLGLCDSISYEGQAAIRLQNAASNSGGRVYSWKMENGVLDFGPMVREIARDAEAGADPGAVASGFHSTMAEGVSRMCREIADSLAIEDIALSGGVFQNELLLELLTDRLEKLGLRAHFHRFLPPNDACLSYGQAVAALVRIRKNQEQRT